MANPNPSPSCPICVQATRAMLLSGGADPSTCQVTTALVKVWQTHSDHEILAQHTLASLQHLAQGKS